MWFGQLVPKSTKTSKGDQSRHFLLRFHFSMCLVLHETKIQMKSADVLQFLNTNLTNQI